jgi:acyl-CoA reductase-like NAD-dependent aldehyde dehydrogenase
MELGGKDPAYVLSDSNIDYAVENIVDGAFFNSGQCCCSIERCYVHADVYDAFVEKAVALTQVIRYFQSAFWLLTFICRNMF